MSSSSFTFSTSGGQKITVNRTSPTTYQKGTSSASASEVTTGEPVLVLGTVNGTTIAATQVTVQPTGGDSSTANQVVPFKRGAPSEAKKVGPALERLDEIPGIAPHVWTRIGWRA